MKLGRMNLPAREVASSSPGALSMSMSVAAEVGLERHKDGLVRSRNLSVDLRKHEQDTHPEATGTSILMRGNVFRALEGATLGCLATFSVGSGVDVRVRF